jgi:hypothetical protein
LIKSSHFNKLKEFDITHEKLLKYPCICIYTVAWIDAKKLRQYGRSRDTIGMYNTGRSPKLIKQPREYAAIIKIIYRAIILRDEVYTAMAKQNKKAGTRKPPHCGSNT